MIFNNMLRSGKVLNPADPHSEALDSFNKRIRDDTRVENVLLPVRDGLMLVVKL